MRMDQSRNHVKVMKDGILTLFQSLNRYDTLLTVYSISLKLTSSIYLFLSLSIFFVISLLARCFNAAPENF
jgi:hypothetical protein